MKPGNETSEYKFTKDYLKASNLVKVLSGILVLMGAYGLIESDKIELWLAVLAPVITIIVSLMADKGVIGSYTHFRTELKKAHQNEEN